MAAEVDPAGDLPELHRYNEKLPDEYKAQIATESRLQLEALRRLARAIVDDEPAPEGDADPAAGDVAHGQYSEGYGRQLECDLSAFDKGLSRYLTLKYPLTAADYDAFARLLVLGILTPGMDIGLRAKLAKILSRVLRKKDCRLTFPIPWRALRDIIVAVHIDSADGDVYVGRDVRDAHCREMLALLRKSRRYLAPDDDAQVIWNELFPKINPERPDSAFEPLLMMSHVLPTRGEQWSGWIPAAFDMWRSLDNSSDWDSAWLDIVARFAKHQPNAVDWTPYLSTVYERLPTSFRIPLGAAAPQSPVERRCPAHFLFLAHHKHTTVPAAVLAIYSLTPRRPEPLVHLKRLLAILTNFVHPSNNGKWSTFLSSFLGYLTMNLAVRVATERNATKAGITHRVLATTSIKPVPPMEDRLTDEMVTEIVSLMVPLIQSGLHSKHGFMTIQSATSARDLAIVAPRMVVEPLLNDAADDLVLVATPHRTSAALKMLSTLTPVFLDPWYCPDGAETLPRALELALPGIDANDTSKTESTFRFIAGASARLQSYRNTEQNSDLVGFLDSYAGELLDRVLALLESLEAPPKKNKNGHVPHVSTLSVFIFQVAMENFLSAVPKSVCISSAERVVRHVSGAASPDALKFYGALVRITAAAAAAASPDGSSAPIFVPPLVNQIVEQENGREVLTALSDDELVWRLRMLAQACRTCKNVEKYADRIFVAVDLAMRHTSRKVYKAGGRLFRGMMEGLTCTRIDFGSGKGNGDDSLDNQFAWVVPSATGWEAGKKLLVKAIALARELAFKEGHSGTTPSPDDVRLGRDELFRTLRVLHAAQRGGRWIMAGALSPKFNRLWEFAGQRSIETMSKTEAKLILKMPVVAGFGGESQRGNASRAVQLWSELYSITASVLEAVVLKRPDDGSLLYRCLEPIELAHEPFRKASGGSLISRTEKGYKMAYKTAVAMKTPFGVDGGVGRQMPRFIQKLRIQALLESRLVHGARAGLCCDALFERILERLVVLSLNDFPKVRAHARGVLTRSLRVSLPWVRRRMIMSIIQSLESATEIVPEKGTVDYDKLMGAADVLRSSSVVPYVIRDWNLFNVSVRALVRAIVASERPDSAAVVGSLFAKLASTARPLGIGPLELARSTAEYRRTRPAVLTDHPDFVTYLSLVDFLLKEATGGNKSGSEQSSGWLKSHWRLQSLVATTLYICLRTDVLPPLPVVEFFTRAMCSEVLALRQISFRAVALMLAFLRRGLMAAANPILNCIRRILCEPEFCRLLIHTLALDLLDDSPDGIGAGSGDGMGSFANLSLMSLSRTVDGDACWALVMGRPWPSSWVPRSRDTMAIVRARLFEALADVFGEDLVRAVKPTVIDLAFENGTINGVTKENCRVLVAEVVTGLGRGLRSSELTEECSSWLRKSTLSVLDSFSGQDGMVNGGTMIRMLATGPEGSFGREVATLLTSQMTTGTLLDPEMAAHMQARKLRYIHSALADLGPRSEEGAEIVGLLVPELTCARIFGHSLKHVREEVARCLSLLSKFCQVPAVTVYSKGVEEVSSRLQPEEELPDPKVSSTSNDTDEPKKARSREGETLSRWIAVVNWNGDSSAFGRYITVVLPSLFASIDDSDNDRVAHARLALSLAAQARLDRDVVERLVACSEEAAKSPRWKVRVATLPFLQVIAFTRNFAVPEEVVTRIRETIIRLLSDERLEVREAAAHTLIPLIRDARSDDTAKVRDLLVRQLHTTSSASGRRRNKKENVSASTLIERHAAVLGLSSMVMSAPYAVPPWMPEVLVALTGCIADPAPISASTRKLFAEFWRTHRDEWAAHKEAFAEDQLESVSELLIAPSYYV